ncbi:MAG: hypothetical protein Q9160_004552 [Pyrenula sp. 1 TL-2023]
MAKVQGHCDLRFQALSHLLQKNLDAGSELGASLCVNLHGTNVVDIWGGHQTTAQTTAWSRDTITCIWSSTKCVTSLAALMLISRGLLSPNEKVSTYWPEFAANGKENVRVRHILSHTSGLPGWEGPITPEDVYDLSKSTDMLAKQKPWWEPGIASGYQAMTMGHMVDELVQRVAGKSLKQFIADEIAGPLGADFQLGAKEEDWGRCADIVPPPDAPPQQPADEGDGKPPPPAATAAAAAQTSPPAPNHASIAAKVHSNISGVSALTAHTPAWRYAALGASNGHSNARALARILSVISLGGSLDNMTFLSPQTISLIFEEQANGTDLVVGERFRFGLGYALTGRGTYVGWLPNPETENEEGGKGRGGKRICLWGGWGGSIGLMDLERGLTVAYVMNKMEQVSLGSERTKEYVRGVYKVLGVEI